MRSTQADSTAPSTASSREDEGLRCPQCEYNLTGLTERRCPECGTPFDPDFLREALEGAVRPIPGWDDRVRSREEHLLRVCRMIMFKPAEFARRFPLRCDPRSVREFWWVARIYSLLPIALMALFCLMILAAIGGFVPVLSMIVASCILVVLFLVGTLACEALLVMALKGVTVLKPDVPLFSWWSYVVMHGCFLVATVNICPALLLVTVAVSNDADLYMWIVGVAEAVIVCWWWYSLAQGIIARCQRGWRLVAGVLAVPLAAVAAFLCFAVAPISCIAALG